jgi:hypothetical protein
MPEVRDMAFKSITTFQAPPQIERMVHRRRLEEGAAVYVVEDGVYIVVSRGEKPTGGYGIRVANVEEEEDGSGFNVLVEYQDPKPGQLVAQVVTYPFAVVKVDLKNIKNDTAFKFLVDGNRWLECTAERLE